MDLILQAFKALLSMLGDLMTQPYFVLLAVVVPCLTTLFIYVFTRTKRSRKLLSFTMMWFIYLLYAVVIFVDLINKYKKAGKFFNWEVLLNDIFSFEIAYIIPLLFLGLVVMLLTVALSIVAFDLIWYHLLKNEPVLDKLQQWLGKRKKAK